MDKSPRLNKSEESKNPQCKVRYFGVQCLEDEGEHNKHIAVVAGRVETWYEAENVRML